MATADTSPPKPDPAPAASASTPAQPAPVPARKKFDITRPIRYASGFIGGTVTHTLDDMANGGRKGMWLGVGIGFLMMITGGAGGLGLLALGWAGGLVAGAVAGGAIGLVTGGARGIGLEARKTKYADDLIVRAQERSRPAPRADYRAVHREYTQNANYTLDRIFQQQRETAADLRQQESSTWRDHVEQSRAGGFHEHGV